MNGKDFRDHCTQNARCECVALKEFCIAHHVPLVYIQKTSKVHALLSPTLDLQHTAQVVHLLFLAWGVFGFGACEMDEWRLWPGSETYTQQHLLPLEAAAFRLYRPHIKSKHIWGPVAIGWAIVWSKLLVPHLEKYASDQFHTMLLLLATRRRDMCLQRDQSGRSKAAVVRSTGRVQRLGRPPYAPAI